MGHSMGSEYKRGVKCCKCGKKLLYYRKIKGHDEFDEACAVIMPERRAIRMNWDPSKGTTSGYLYGWFCEECWEKDDGRQRKHC